MVWGNFEPGRNCESDSKLTLPPDASCIRAHWRTNPRGLETDLIRRLKTSSLASQGCQRRLIVLAFGAWLDCPSSGILDEEFVRWDASLQSSSPVVGGLPCCWRSRKVRSAEASFAFRNHRWSGSRGWWAVWGRQALYTLRRYRGSVQRSSTGNDFQVWNWISSRPSSLWQSHRSFSASRKLHGRTSSQVCHPLWESAPASHSCRGQCQLILFSQSYARCWDVSGRLLGWQLPTSMQAY